MINNLTINLNITCSFLIFFLLHYEQDNHQLIILMELIYYFIQYFYNYIQFIIKLNQVQVFNLEFYLSFKGLIILINLF